MTNLTPSGMLPPGTAGEKPEAAALLAWYDRGHRRLPWRAPPGGRADPYAVWLSEIMLQQTTVAAVKPYFEAFLKRWPDVRALAAAPLEDVLAAWAGLGYYSRARNLHACAVLISTRHGGRFPDDEAGLRTLPGVGAYTAAAIAAIAFSRRAVVVDGNVERVMARYFAVREPLPGTKPRLRELADLLTPGTRAGDYAQAVMDLGATICTPRNPACALCPLNETCMAHREGVAAELPAKAAKAERPTRRGAAFVVLDPARGVLLRSRSPKGLLGGMSEPPMSDWTVDAPLPRTPEQSPFPAEWRPAGAIEHVFTHFRLELAVFAAWAPPQLNAPYGARWVALSALDRAALPTVMRKAIERGLAALDEPAK